MEKKRNRYPSHIKEKDNIISEFLFRNGRQCLTSIILTINTNS